MMGRDMLAGERDSVVRPRLDRVVICGWWGRFSPC